MRIVFSSILLLLFSYYPIAAQPHRFIFEHNQMGTTFRIVMYTSDSTLAAGSAQEAFDRIDTLNHIMSDYDPESELNHLSATSGTDQWVPVSDELWKVMNIAAEISAQTKGAFDITVGPMVQLWRRSRRKQQLPTAEALESAKSSVGFSYIMFDSTSQRVKLIQKEMRLDLGGIAKGYAVDEALKVINDHGIRYALVDGGGDIALGDPPPGTKGWNIGMEMLDYDQRLTNRDLYLSNCAVATSGDTYRYVELGGVRYSHIIDPGTGLGLSIRRKVTVISPSGTYADAYASAVSVLGSEKGVGFIENKEDTEVLIIENIEEQLTQNATNNFWSFIESP